MRTLNDETAGDGAAAGGAAAGPTAPAVPRTLPLGTAVLVALTAIGPVSFQIFLPALPAIQSGFGVEVGTAQLALSLSMGGIALATLAYGPLSDRYGRRPTLVAGMVLLVLGSLLCAAAPTIELLITGRILQAAGGAAGMVVTRAIVMDVHGREGARAVLANLMTAMVAAPALATPLGGLLADHLGWRSNFIAIALCGAAMLAYLWRALPETHVGDRTGGIPLAGFGQLARMPSFDGYALQSGFAMAAFIAFTTASPYYFAETLGIGATGFGLYAVLVTLGFMAGSIIASRLSGTVPLRHVVLAGSAAALAASLVALGLAAGGVWTVWALVLPAAALGAANGLAMPSAQAGAVAAAPKLAGTASGFAGFIGTLLAAITTQVVGILQNGTPFPIVGAMVATSALALLAGWVASRWGGAEDQD